MDLKLAGKVALITGSSRGIGLATAKAFAAEGCRLMLSGRSAEPLAEVEAALRRGRSRSRGRCQQAR
jgi:3-oxoacyl-[acyl-carrier protein] reductase